MPAPATDVSLSFDELYRGFGRLQVLKGVSGRVEKHQLLSISGSNGCGKSTLLRCLAGLMNPQKGEIVCRLDGHELSTAERRLAVGYVSPDLELYPELTTFENLAFFGRLRGIDPERGRELLERVGLPANRPAATLSSGMRQRLRWIWALLHQPSILLLDEPLQNLDEAGRQSVMKLLQHHLENGLAVVANPDRLDLPHVASHLDLDR